MANRPSNETIEQILARRRKAGQPAKKESTSQAEIEQSVKEAVNDALGETNANLSNFLKDFKESIEKQKLQNKNKTSFSQFLQETIHLNFILLLFFFEMFCLSVLFNQTFPTFEFFI